MHAIFKNVLLCFCTLIGLHVDSFCQTWTNELDSVLRQLEAESLYDGQILIAERGEILFNESYGSMLKNGKEIDIVDTTPMVVYSVGKSMTSLAVLQLAEAGKLDLADPVTKYFPDLPYGNVSIKSLMTMTSGLPRFLETVLHHADTAMAISNADIISLIARHKPKGSNPGERFEYTNANYILLASLVEKLAAMPFAEYLQKHIFDPLKMDHSYETTPEVLKKLSFSGTTSENFHQPFGIGSVATTASDLYKYADAIMNGTLFDTEGAFDCIKLADGSMSNYGFGWKLNDCDSLHEVYHVGDGVNMRASLQLFMDGNRIFIYLHPTSNTYHESVYWVVRNIWEGKNYELPRKRVNYSIDTALFEKYVGSYLSGFGLVHISRENGKLFLRPDAIPGKEELVPSSDTTFYFAGQNLEWEFFLNENGEVEGFGIRGDRENMGIRQGD